MTRRLKRVYVDLDDTIADMRKAYVERLGIVPTFTMSEEEFWYPVRTHAPDLFRHLPFCEGALCSLDVMHTLLAARAYADAGFYTELVLLTSVPHASGMVERIMEDKAHWCRNRLRAAVDVELIQCHGSKSEHCQPGDVLIDDWAGQHKNAWEGAGGYFIHHTGFASTIAQLAHVLATHAAAGGNDHDYQ